ncbi:unnamed protein product [Cyclocybe aegerita]|uniref:Uncharacterized protein n=1 Tax=Cyclocybe aegerita TaxID=1973307 RepID=A0A8S0X8P5_CYCAE|nr:unnamed protein product [Cyclocybe aegerita]
MLPSTLRGGNLRATSFAIVDVVVGRASRRRDDICGGHQPRILAFLSILELFSLAQVLRCMHFNRCGTLAALFAPNPFLFYDWPRLHNRFLYNCLPPAAPSRYLVCFRDRPHHFSCLDSVLSARGLFSA